MSGRPGLVLLFSHECENSPAIYGCASGAGKICGCFPRSSRVLAPVAADSWLKNFSGLSEMD
jgi:hypothetical protein